MEHRGDKDFATTRHQIMEGSNAPEILLKYKRVLWKSVEVNTMHDLKSLFDYFFYWHVGIVSI